MLEPHKWVNDLGPYFVRGYSKEALKYTLEHMKKVAIGCGVVAVLVVLAIGVGSFWAYRTARGYITQYAELGRVAELNTEIRNTSAYQPPMDRQLEASQVERYVTVQRAMLNRLGTRVRELETKYEQLAADLERSGRDANLRTILEVWGDVVSLVVDAKAAQVEALNAQHFSLAEYHWVRRQVMLALGLGHPGFNLELLAEDPVRILEALEQADAPPPEILQHNRALLVDHEDTVDEWLPLSFFGL